MQPHSNESMSGFGASGDAIVKIGCRPSPSHSIPIRPQANHHPFDFHRVIRI